MAEERRWDEAAGRLLVQCGRLPEQVDGGADPFAAQEPLFATAVAAFLDRLLQHAHVLTCGPRSWRTRLQGDRSDA